MNINDLNQEQKDKISQWVANGHDLNSLQKLINSEFNLRLTFMDTRFLILDLGLEIQTPMQQEETKADDNLIPEETTQKGTGKLDLSVNEITRPGMVMSGEVTFPSGAHGSWFIDSQYRMGLDPDVSSPEPTEEDMKIFQQEIRGFLRNHMGGI